MSNPNDGGNPPVPPPPGGGSMPPPPGETPAPPPPPPSGGAPNPYPGGSGDQPEKKSSLPAVSLILSILSFFCLPIILAVIGIVTGFMGRKRAKEEGTGSGLATAGIVLGFINIIIAGIVITVLAVAGVAIFNTVSGQVEIAEDLQKASASAEAYRQQNGSYRGLSTGALADFGYQPKSDLTVTAASDSTGMTYCIEGYKNGEPSNVIHVPPLGSSVSIEINGRQYAYSPGECGPGFE